MPRISISVCDLVRGKEPGREFNLWAERNRFYTRRKKPRAEITTCVCVCDHLGFHSSRTDLWYCLKGNTSRRAHVCACLCVIVSGQYRGTKTGECVDLGASWFTTTHTRTWHQVWGHGSSRLFLFQILHKMEFNRFSYVLLMLFSQNSFISLDRLVFVVWRLLSGCCLPSAVGFSSSYPTVVIDCRGDVHAMTSVLYLSLACVVSGYTKRVRGDVLVFLATVEKL